MAKASTFGAFFQETRKGLGLTLREFCRQNGFDSGNVSRIERGLSLPPKAEEVLQKYAKALKMKQGTEHHNRFLDLAAKETGRIPTELLENPMTAGQLPKLLRQLRSGSGHRNWITARHLEQWADKLDARAVLPQLVRRLIHATGKTIIRIEFPSGEQTQRPGWDGVVEVMESNAFLPSGRIVFEMGVNKSPATKAEEDFTKRKRQKVGFDKKETTYIVVTPRKWQSKGAWVDAKQKLGVWKEVRVYDSANLEEWIEQAPAVDVWLAKLMEVKPEGLTTIDEYWENLEGLTDPTLKPEVFLASRHEKVDEFKAWLAGPPSVAVIETRSPSEAVDFVAAVIRQSATHETARTLIVEEKAAWRSVCRSGSRLILIAHPSLVLESEFVAEAVRQGHHVILPVSQSLTDRAFTLKLPRVYRHDLQKALELSEMKHSEATEWARKAGGSLTVLKRLLAKSQGTGSPAWCQGAEVLALMPMLLAGAWEDTNEGDRAVLERLSGGSYQDVLATSNGCLRAPDPPLAQVLSRWNLISRDDSWWLLSHYMTSEHLIRFEQAALDVLGESDPALELPLGERWMAKIHNKSLGCSHALRNGMAETLALLGARPERIANSLGVPGLVEQIVHRLLNGKDWKRWASLSAQLPLLAEAAPDAFLKAVERDLRAKEPALLKLFEQDGHSVPFSTSPHAGLLWALERLAWDRGLLPQVSYILARLDEALVVKNKGNSPIRSLNAIFLPWYPQTTAPVDERVQILSAIGRKHPGTGWRLLIELLPGRSRTTMPITRPAYRDWALTWTEGSTFIDHQQQVTACAEMMVDGMGRDLARWKDLIEHFGSLAVSAGEKFLQQLLDFDISTLDTPARRVVAEALRKEIVDHRRFHDTNWALPKTVLDSLEQAQKRFEPADAVSRNAWLFNQMWEVIEHDEKINEKAISELRLNAVGEVVAESGWDGVLAFAIAVRASGKLGRVVGQSATTEDDVRVLPCLLEEQNEKLSEFARGYVYGRFQAGQWGWVEQLKINNWSNDAVADLALCLPNQTETWDFLAKKGNGAEKAFWMKSTDQIHEPNQNVVRIAISKLLEHGRPSQACFVLWTARQQCPIESELALKVLEARVTQPLAESEKTVMGYRHRYVLELLQHLQKEVRRKESAVEQTRVANLEWGYLELLEGHHATPDVLHSVLQTDPKFFTDLLGVIYRSHEDDAEEMEELSDDMNARVQNGFQLLMSWKSVPGSNDDNTVDEDALLTWVRTARAIAKDQGRLEVCDSCIGQMLAHSPSEVTDGGWPCIPVRDAIEEINSDDLANGFEVGIYNKRGGYSKAMDAGGEQERVIAKRYLSWAEICKIDWPRTAGSLRRVAEGYDREASRADADRESRLM